MSDAIIITGKSWSEPQQDFRAILGIWVFLATEILFFGGMFLAYTVLRLNNYAAFNAAGAHTSFVFGTANTAILVTSAFSMAIAVEADKHNDHSALRWGLGIAIFLGIAFLCVKGAEYHEDWTEHLVPGPQFPIKLPAAQSFFALYWVMTALHAVHLTVGIGVAGRMWFFARKNAKAVHFHRSLEVSALYWHLIDVIWVMLYPLFYLVGRS